MFHDIIIEYHQQLMTVITPITYNNFCSILQMLYKKFLFNDTTVSLLQINEGHHIN